MKKKFQQRHRPTRWSSTDIVRKPVWIWMARDISRASKERREGQEKIPKRRREEKAMTESNLALTIMEKIQGSSSNFFWSARACLDRIHGLRGLWSFIFIFWPSKRLAPRRWSSPLPDGLPHVTLTSYVETVPTEIAWWPHLWTHRPIYSVPHSRSLSIYLSFWVCWPLIPWWFWSCYLGKISLHKLIRWTSSFTR